MVEQVEELSPELQVRALAESQRKILDDREVGINEARPVDRRTSSGTELPGRRLRKGAGVKPVLDGVDLGRTICSSPRLVGIADLIRPLERAAVIREEDSRFIGAIDDE